MRSFDVKAVLLLLLVAVFGFIVAAFLWMTLYPYTPIVIQKPIEIMNPGKVVKAGDLLVYRIKYEKKMNVFGTLSRKLVNSYKIDLADSVVTAPVGKDCDQIKIAIPQFADPGVYYLWWSAAYKVNPLRTVTVSVESEKFTVVR